MRELAVDGVAVVVACRVLKLSGQPCYRWLRSPVTASELVEACRASVMFDAHRDDPEFGHRLLADEARGVGLPMAGRTVWRIGSVNGWWSVFGRKKVRGEGRKPGLAVYDDFVGGQLAAEGPDRLWWSDVTEHRTRGGQAVPVRGQGCVL